MTKVHNFSAGPGILPAEVLKQAADACINFDNLNLSLLEISHRSKNFEKVMDDSRQLAKDLLGLNDNYKVLFLGGGASLQFSMVPYNLLRTEGTAGYINTGVWASKAIKEAKMIGNTTVVASSEDKKFSYIPKGYEIPNTLDYLHITSNNTIYGTQIYYDIDSPVPLVADMSSDIFSRPIDIKKYDLIYAGAQKNLAPAGVTLVIVRKEALGKSGRPIPTMINYQTHIEGESMFNTPPVLPVFAALQTLIWLKDNGGIKAMEVKNIAKAKLLYDEIDRNKLFVCPVPDPEDRSRMNVTFVMAPGYEELEKSFQARAKELNILGIEGHRSVGGFRASIYNAMPVESVQVLVDAMKEFESQN